MGILIHLGIVAALLAAGADCLASVGRAVFVQGDVLIRNESDPNSPNAKNRSLKPGDHLEQGDVINTGSTGAAKILMSDDTILDLAPSTLFKVDEFKLNNNAGDRNVQISMPYGKVRTSVNQPVKGNGKFVFKTKTATLGVRGTEFIVSATLGAKAGPGELAGSGRGLAEASAPEGKTEVTVVHGTVMFANPSSQGSVPIALTTGNHLVSGTGNSAPTLATLSSSQTLATQMGSKVQDQTFKDVYSDKGSGNSNGKGNGNSGSGGATSIAAAAISDMIASTPPTPPKSTEVDVPGSFSQTSNPIASTAPTQQGMPATIRVVVTK